MRSIAPLRPTPLALALFATSLGALTPPPASAARGDGAERLPVTAAAAAAGTELAGNPRGARYSAPNADGTQRYIVVFRAAPLAGYKGETAGYARIPAAQTHNAIAHPDVASPEAQKYVSHLQSLQQQFASDLSARFGRQVALAGQYQHAINAVAVDLSADEAAQVQRREDVLTVNREQVRKLLTYATPTFIGAATIWNGSSTPGGVASKGEGIVIGEIDSGINWASNSFKATGSDGVPVVNPLGTGVFKGNCVAGGKDAGVSPAPNHCNDKLIGIYNLEGNVSGQDLDGHGSHTASTAAGNYYNTAPYNGATFSVSGVAPHANVIAYLACGTTSNSCLDTQLTAAVNQVVADGIVDAVNYSIGGPTPSPWTDTIQLAFLGAANAGVFVATAAGNDGPTPATATENQAPWTTTVAATTPPQIPAFQLSLNSPAGAPNTIGLAAIPGSSPYPTQAYNNLRLIESPTFADGSNDGCTAFAANTFRAGGVAAGAQGIAVLHLDQNASNCGSSTRRTNAANAGAIAVIYVDPLFIGLGATGASYSVLMSDWNNIKATPGIDVTPTGNAVGSISYPISAGPRPADNIAGFSSRGPIAFANLKPDISAPGDNILAAMSPTATSGYNTANLTATGNIYGVESGTSMATPHITGSAALVRAINRAWTPMEVKSALMTTAVPVLNEDNATPANPNVAGAGRVDLTRATKAGLLFNESYDNFVAANPATGGKPESLNIASLYHPDCTNACSFKRTVRSSGSTGTWTLAVTGDLPAGSFSLDKTSFTLGSSGSTSFTFGVNALNLTAGQWYYGQLTLTSSNPAVPVQHLPIAIRPATAKLRSDKSTVSASAVAGASTTQTVTVSNAGNPGLNWSFSTTTLPGTIVNRVASNTGLPDRTIGSGTVISSTNASNSYGADYFDVLSNGTTVTRLQMSGFNANGSTLPTIATQLAWRLFGDAANLPNGRPGVAADTQPVFTYQSAATAAGTSYSGDAVALDFAAAGTTAPVLNAGRYWFSMAPTVASTSTANSWYWLLSEVAGKAPSAQYVIPNSTTQANKVYRATTLPAVGGPTYTGYAMRVDVNAACSAPWLGYSTQSGTLGLNGSIGVTLTFDASSLSPGTYTTYACLGGNGTSPPNNVTADTDTILIPVTFTVTAPSPTSPAASAGTAAPASAPIGTQTLLSVQIAPGANPASSGIAVSADLSSIGGAAAQAFADDGQNGDVMAGDGIYSFLATVGAGTAPGGKTVPVTVTDAQSRTGSTSISLSVPAPGPLGASGGMAAPNEVDAGSDVTLSVQVAAGTTPPSTGVTATADLSSIGGSATQAMTDNLDGSFSLVATVANGTAPGAKSVPVSVADAQGRTAATSVDFSVATPTALSIASATATPTVVLPGESTHLSVQVGGGTHPASSGVLVTADLAVIGDSDGQALNDDGGGSFSIDALVDAATTPGVKLVTVHSTDAQGRSASTVIGLSVPVAGGLSGAGIASPNSALPGDTVLLMVAVNPGTNPASTGTTVTVDLSSLGGSATEPMHDDGADGDQTSGDRVYSLRYTLPAGTPIDASLSFTATIADDQARSASAAIVLNIGSDRVFYSGFEETP